MIDRRHAYNLDVLWHSYPDVFYDMDKPSAAFGRNQKGDF
jgi:hypothetical protein